MTLLTISQAVADEIDIQRVSSVIGNTIPDARKLLRLSTKVAKRLIRAYAWSRLRMERTFTAVAGTTQTGVLPSDFDRFVPETFWDRTNKTLVTGPVDAVRWQGMTTNNHSGDPRFALRGGSVLIIPAPLGGESLAFEYVSKDWCESSGGAAQSAWAADSDVARLDEELIALGVIYEWLRSEGLPWEAAAADYMRAFDNLTSNDQPTTAILASGDVFGGGRHYTGEPPSVGTIL